MSTPGSHDSDRRRIALAAANWVLRCDRGLTAEEQDEFSIWLGADPRHGEEIALHRQHWNRLDRLSGWQPEHSEQPNPDLLAPPLKSRLSRWLPRAAVGVGLAAAAVMAVRLLSPEPASKAPAPAPSVVATSDAGPRRLVDGTVAELNRGAELTVHFGAAERRVRVERGEVHFKVAKEANRPFVVLAGSVQVRALGTAFNVRRTGSAVEVLVTEGSVTVASGAGSAQSAGDSALSPVTLIPALSAHQRAVVSLVPQPEPPQIATLTSSEIERVLAWQDRLLDFTAAPLREIVTEFNRRNVVQLVVADAELASIPISGSFRSDNLDGFTSLLEVGFGARAERRGETEIVLRKPR